MITMKVEAKIQEIKKLEKEGIEERKTLVDLRAQIDNLNKQMSRHNIREADIQDQLQKFYNELAFMLREEKE